MDESQDDMYLYYLHHIQDDLDIYCMFETVNIGVEDPLGLIIVN